jgi:pilus assembly protein Flp/PilA
MRIIPRHSQLGLFSMTKLIRKFLRNEQGATAIEYGLIASLIGVAIIAGATALGTSLNSTFQGIAGNINGPSA